MAEAILRDHKRILPCAVMLEGEYDIRGLFIGVLCKLGGGGMEKVIEIKLNADEKAMLDKSTEAVKGLVEALKNLKDA